MAQNESQWEPEEGDSPRKMPSPPWAVRFLIAVNVGFFLLELSVSGPMGLFPGIPASTLAALGANYAPAIWEGQVWRLVVSSFLHGNLIHILLNMYGLSVLGRLLEPALGRIGTVVLYLGSAVVASAASVAYSGGISVGASGAVFGFVGALLAFTWLARDKPPARTLAQSLIYIVVINLGLAWFINQSSSGMKIDNYAHVAGLVAGLAIGLAVFGSRKSGAFSVSSLVGHAAYAAVALMAIGQAMHPRNDPRYHAFVGFTTLELDPDNVNLAEGHADTSLAIDPYNPGGLALKVAVCRHQNDDGCTTRTLGILTRLDTHPLLRGVPEANEEDLLHGLRLLGAHSLRRKDHPIAAFAFCRGSQLAPASDELANDCAWEMLAQGGLTPLEKQRALELADRARRLGGGMNPAINHTLAEALHQNGRTGDAIHLLERMLSGELGGVGFGQYLSAEGETPFDEEFLRSEIARMQREAAERAHVMGQQTQESP